jgi:hypothetical protein
VKDNLVNGLILIAILLEGIIVRFSLRLLLSSSGYELGKTAFVHLISMGIGFLALAFGILAIWNSDKKPARQTLLWIATGTGLIQTIVWLLYMLEF